jgi:hypothetical protein
MITTAMLNNMRMRDLTPPPSVPSPVNEAFATCRSDLATQVSLRLHLRPDHTRTTKWHEIEEP